MLATSAHTKGETMARAPQPEKTPPPGLTPVHHDPTFGYWVRAGLGIGIGIMLWTAVASVAGTVIASMLRGVF